MRENCDLCKNMLKPDEEPTFYILDESERAVFFVSHKEEGEEAKGY